MKQLLPFLIGLGMLVPTTGCVVKSRSRHQHVHRRDCPPGHHWHDGRCVHNGRGHGHGKGRGRPHR